MNRKSPLSLMELLIMVMVFALASALCLKTFVYADNLSARDAELAAAQREAQNMAEILKAVRGDLAEAVRLGGGKTSGGSWTLYFDGNGKLLAEEKEDGFSVTAACAREGLLGSARISAVSGRGDPLCELKAAWQLPAGEEAAP